MAAYSGYCSISRMMFQRSDNLGTTMVVLDHTKHYVTTNFITAAGMWERESLQESGEGDISTPVHHLWGPSKRHMSISFESVNEKLWQPEIISENNGYMNTKWY